MEKKTKFETLIGFAIKSGKTKIGAGAVETLRRAELIIVCKSASENSISKAKKLARKLGARLYVTTVKPLEEITYKINSKIMAITDVQFAKSIIDVANQELDEVGVISNG